MKNILRSFVAGILVTLCFSTQAQTTVTIGTDTTTMLPNDYPAPYGNWFWGAKHQILFLASELNAAGITGPVFITELGFEVGIPNPGTGGTCGSPVPLSDFEIKMKQTGSTSVNTAFETVGLIHTFGPVNYTESAGWNTHVFTTP